MDWPDHVIHLESPREVPLQQPFTVRGWIAAATPVHSVAAGAKDGTWLTLVDRPDVRAAHPNLPHVAGFHGQASFLALDHGTLRLSCQIGDTPLLFSQALLPVELPPDHLQVRQVGGVWGPEFYAAGEAIFGQLAAAFNEVGEPLEHTAAVLDFGCGCGRVLRSFRALRPTGEVWGSDIDAEAIAWNRAHLGDIGQFCCNAPRPPLPFADGHFSAIYSVSVFTHLPEELQFAWLEELRRVLRPGGVLLASVHGRRYWSADPGVKAEVETRGHAYRTGAVTDGLPDFYMSAFHSEAYVRREWARYFDIVAYKENYVHGAHDLAVVRRR